MKEMQILNLKWKFDKQKIKQSEIIKKYSNKLLSIDNKVRLFGINFSDSTIIQKMKMIVTISWEFEVTII